jgi:hypothetical protein
MLVVEVRGACGSLKVDGDGGFGRCVFLTGSGRTSRLQCPQRFGSSDEDSENVKCKKKIYDLGCEMNRWTWQARTCRNFHVHEARRDGVVMAG